MSTTDPTDHVRSEDARWIGPIEISRGNYYWVARGPVPLAVARELYDHPVGRIHVRVDGNGMSPAPVGKHVRWYTSEGLRVLPSEEDPSRQSMSPVLQEAWDRYRHRVAFHDQPEVVATACIETYHIDHDDALALFESVLRKHGVDARSRPTWWDERF